MSTPTLLDTVRQRRLDALASLQVRKEAQNSAADHRPQLIENTVVAFRSRRAEDGTSSIADVSGSNLAA